MQPVPSVDPHETVQPANLGDCPVQIPLPNVNIHWPEIHSKEGQILLKAGLTPTVLWEQWGLVLWRFRVKGNGIKLKAEAYRPVDEVSLFSWLSKKLGPDMEISFQLSPAASCCGSGCKGCLIGNVIGSR
jgi:hypothetical protein